MTFHELTRMMLNSMDFFELRRTAARYQVAFQGIRRQKLIRDIERKILLKSMTKGEASAGPIMQETIAAQSPEGAVLARPPLVETTKKAPASTRINTFSARGGIPRVVGLK